MSRREGKFLSLEQALSAKIQKFPWEAATKTGF